MAINRVTLAHFTGTQAYTRFSSTAPNLLLTDGALYVAENGGDSGAYWLMHAIASYQTQLLNRYNWASEMQVWTLEVNNNKSATLICQHDSASLPEIREVIRYTDFDLAKIALWVMPAGYGKFVIMLPSEY